MKHGMDANGQLFDPEPADAPEPADDEQARRFERLSERASVLRAIRLTAFTCHDGKSVGGPAQFAVLTVLADRAGASEWWITFAQLAAQAQLGERQAKRAVEALRRRGIIRVRRKRNRSGSAVNHYRMNWPRAQEFVADTAAERNPQRPRQSATGVTSTSATGVTSASAAGVTSVSDTGGTCIRKRTEEAPREAHLEDVHKTKTPSASPSHGDGDGVSRMVWGRKIDERELRDAESIDGLYWIAVAQGIATGGTADRLAFFALVVWVRRQPEIVNRVGLLTNILSGRVPDPRNGCCDWRARASSGDEDQAGRLLREVDGDEVEERSDRAALSKIDAAQAQAAAVAERKRKYQMIPALRAMFRGRMPRESLIEVEGNSGGLQSEETAP